jgi:hypothetical protein
MEPIPGRLPTIWGIEICNQPHDIRRWRRADLQTSGQIEHGQEFSSKQTMSPAVAQRWLRCRGSAIRSLVPFIDNASLSATDRLARYGRSGIGLQTILQRTHLERG